MDRIKRLVNAFNELNEAAAVYRNQKFSVANDLFAEILERSKEDLVDMPVLEVCHNESIEMIRDFMQRRGIEDHGVPMNYTCAFRTPSQPKIMLDVIAIRLQNADDGVLIIVRKA